MVNYGAEIELFINVVQDSRQRRSQKLCHAMGLVSQEVLHIRLSTHNKNTLLMELETWLTQGSNRQTVVHFHAEFENTRPMCPQYIVYKNEP